MPRIIIQSIRFLAAFSAAAMITTKELNPFFIGLFIGLLLLGFLLEKKGTLVKFLGKAQPVFAFLFFLVALFDFFKVSQSFLLVVAHFLIALQGLRLLTLRTVRDCSGSVLLSSMMILSASTLSVEWGFFVFLSIFLPSAIWCLLLLNILSENQLNALARDPTVSSEKLNWVKAGLSEEGFMEEHNEAWRRTLPILRKATGLAFWVASSCCLLVFIIFPRFNFRGFRGQFLQPVHKSGFTNRLDLDKGSRIFLDHSVAMRIEIADQDRSLWPGPVRGSTLNDFDGQVWSHAARGPLRPVYLAHGDLVLAAEKNRKTREIIQNIYLESMESPVLFAAPVPVSFSLDRPYLMVGEDQSVERGRGDGWRVHYQVTSVVSGEDRKRLPFKNSPSSLEHLTDLPPKFDSHGIRRLAREVTRPAENSFRKAEMLEQYLRTQFSYSLDLSPLTGEKVLEKFLFETKKGNCEYFASALCVMLRTLGIPSRLVTGFYAHEWNERGKYYVVRMSDAHAWVEAFVEGEGWIQLDPTPRSFADSDSGKTWPQKIQEMVDLLNLRWNRYILSYDMARQVQLFQTLNDRSRKATAVFDLVNQQVKKWWGPERPVLSSPGPAFFVCILLGGGGLSLIFFLMRRLRPKSPVWFYSRVLRLLEKKGGPKPISQTPLEFISKCQESLGTLLPDFQFLIQEYYRRRFNPTHIISPEREILIRQTLKKIKV